MLGAVWRVLINSAEGARATDPLRLEAAAVLRLTAPERLWFPILPSALPRIFAGLRLSLSLSLILMVFSELLPGSEDGIGFTLTDAQTRSGGSPRASRSGPRTGRPCLPRHTGSRWRRHAARSSCPAPSRRDALHARVPVEPSGGFLGRLRRASQPPFLTREATRCTVTTSQRVSDL
jgi:hypothetical protein